jgi:uncharacterized protein YjbI with pentapeptide repeats
MIAASAVSLQNVRSLQDITESQVYYQYFQAWYEREVPKLGPSIQALTFEQVDRIMSVVAHEMTMRASSSVDEDQFVNIVKDEAKADPRNDLHTLEKQATNRLLLVPEFTAGGRRFTFRHDSLRAYFSARHLSRMFREAPDRLLTFKNFDSVSLLFFIAILKRDDATRSLLVSLYESDVKSGNYRRDVLGVVLLMWALDTGKIDLPYLRDFCANAPVGVRTLLLSNLNSKNLSGLDLSDFDFRNASLRSSKLVSTVLSRTNLQGCVLDGAKMIRAVLDATNLTDVSLRLVDLTECVLSDVNASAIALERVNLT